ncbi:MAG: hypothetical protein KatS3mg050_0839 [Litorilinea sp.]|nr:MAG: hypothetical protein KatS3mg050_0839 [Litorilinea sp.]
MLTLPGLRACGTCQNDERCCYTVNGKLSLKTFWEAVEQRLAECSADELRDILRGMARHVSPSARGEFLAQLGAGVVSSPTPATPWEALLDDIEDLFLEFQEAMASADEWEEDNWRYEYGEDSSRPYDDFVEPVTLLFERTALAFDHGELPLAHQAYRRLFDLLDAEDDYGRGLSLFHLTGLDQKEVVARYLRAVYEVTPLARRPSVLYEEMSRFSEYPFSAHQHMMLEDLLQISPHPLPDQEAFFKAWVAFLHTQSGSRADAWLREAVRMTEGTAGLERLARTEGRHHPRAYLDWFTDLEEAGQYREVLVAAREALEALPDDLPIRAAIADHLCAAASVLNDPESLRAARWEAFLAKPTLARLLDLWEAFPAGKERFTWMQRAAQHMEQLRARNTSGERPYYPTLDLDDLERPVVPDDALLAHARLLAGNWATAHRAVADKKVLGWSRTSSDQGLVLSFLLALLSGQPRQALSPNLERLWLWNLQITTLDRWTYSLTGENELGQRADRIYANYLVGGEENSQLRLEAGQEATYLAWCLDVARKRIDAIVSNQHRKSYNKAANLTVACAEVLSHRGEINAADAWVRDIRERFPRHHAFQRELRTALSRRT